MSTQMIVRIDPELKEKAGNLAKAEGRNISEVVRELLENYVKDRDISEYIDGLWERIGIKIKEKGISVSDIDSVISQVRTGK
jgi:predicted DNA-binding protein